MTPEDIEQIATIVVIALDKKIDEKKQNFWIDAESHYNYHKNWSLDQEAIHDLKQIIGMYRDAKGLLYKGFLGLAVIGSALISGYVAIKEWIK